MDRGYGIFVTGATGLAMSKPLFDKFTKGGPGGRKLFSRGGDTEASSLGVGPQIVAAGS